MVLPFVELAQVWTGQETVAGDCRAARSKFNENVVARAQDIFAAFFANLKGALVVVVASV